VEAAYDSFITTVMQKAQISWEGAERASRATLVTLAERVSEGQARDLAAQLPAELAGWLATDSGAERFDVDEFVSRVARREHVDLESAERHAHAVFLALGRGVDAGEFADVAAELPTDYAPLVAEGAGRFAEIVTAEQFLARVADRAGLDVLPARRATEAVLETLGERIAGTEVRDLLSELPVELHPPLRLGRSMSRGKAQPMSLDEFVRRVAEREGITDEDAREDTRAVLTTLREAVSEQEFLDVAARLPREYAALTRA
jgi:uncharacterized protein (DUF2267 family)